MYSDAPNAVRFREARERAGLSPQEAANLMGISTPSLWDIECSDELTIYSPIEVSLFCQVLGIQSRDLFGIQSTEPPITATDLAAIIRLHCKSKAITIDQFAEASGWHVAPALDDPEKFLQHGYSIAGIQDICRELGVDWQRFVLSL